ncbi:VOC family protein [Amycolatopsis jejuensis]|uniref:VOC family protein n=1 Tax=Amycolatopsis jejuensis TaxID=330084 RepID=UPI000690CFE8|nr:VOC family protein [Amycolatopsis jejuensis]
MTLITTTGLHHLRLTVTELDRSCEFYTNVLGFEIAARSTGSADDPEVRADPWRFYGGVVLQANGMLLGLRPVAEKSERFVSERVGLDHLSFTVDSVNELELAVHRLDEAGVEHGDIIEWADLGIAILSFDDPDGIHLELTAPL